MGHVGVWGGRKKTGAMGETIQWAVRGNNGLKQQGDQKMSET